MVVLLSGFQAERSHAGLGLKPPAVSIGGLARVMQATGPMGNGRRRRPSCRRAGSGRPRTTDLREVTNAILYIATTGRQGVQSPKDFPLYSTVQRHFYGWRDNGLLQSIRFALAMETREWRHGSRKGARPVRARA